MPPGRKEHHLDLLGTVGSAPSGLRPLLIEKVTRTDNVSRAWSLASINCCFLDLFRSTFCALGLFFSLNYSLFSNNLVLVESKDYPKHNCLVTAEVVVFNE